MSTISPAPPAALPGEYIVGFDPAATPSQRRDALRTLRPVATQPLDSISAVHVRSDPRRQPTASLIRQLDADPLVRWVQPNYLQYLRAPQAAPTPPADPLYPGQYAHHNTGQTGGTPDADMNVPQAWTSTRGSADVVVAVPDTSVDVTHPDLRSNVWTNPGEVAGNGRDDDGNGYVDDVHGWNFIYDSPDVTRGGDSHGTHTAGIVAATADNGVGVAGVAPGVRVMPLPILGGRGATVNAVKAFDYAVSNGARIISNSWGNNTWEPALAEAVADATRRGAAVVVAAGNENWDTGIVGSYPDNYAGSTSIAASDHNDRKARYSNRSQVTIDAAAPGDQVLSTVPGGRYAKYSGTSMAAPAVAGVMALVASKYPNLDMRQVEDRVLQSVRRDGTAAAWNDLVASGGRVDAQAALTPLATPSEPALRSSATGRVVKTARAQAPVGLRWKSDVRDGQRFEVQASINPTATATVEEGFEGGLGERFRHAGDRTWEPVRGTAHTGDGALRVAGLGRGEQARLELTETVPEPTDLSFWYKGEGRPGKLSFFVDRNLQFEPTDDTRGEWRRFSTRLEPGEHTLTWMAGARSAGNGQLLLDDVRIGNVSRAEWKAVGTTEPGATSIEWVPDGPAPQAQLRLRADNGVMKGAWLPSPVFPVRAPAAGDVSRQAAAAASSRR